MKTVKKLAALLLIAAMLLGLAGCSASETKMGRALQKLGKADSLRMDIVDDLIVSVTAGGARLPVSVSLSATLELYFDPLQAKVDAVIGWPGSELYLLMYLQEEDDKTVNVYSNLNGGEAWTKTSFVIEDSRADTKGLRYIIEGVDAFREVEQPGVTDGSHRYDGNLPGSFIQGYLSLYGVEERIERDFGLDLPDELFTNLNSVPTSLWVNEYGELDLIILEPTALLNGLLPKLSERTRAASGLDQLPLTHTIERNQIIIQLSCFDDLPAFEIPENVLALWGESALDWK